MVFGFAGAAVTGYALTLIPNWTGRFPLQGWRLAMLAGLWVAGRLAVAGSALLGAWARLMLVDLALPALVLAASAREGRDRPQLAQPASARCPESPAVGQRADPS